MASQLERNPVFIVGMQRSGTSVIYRTLLKHQDVAFFQRKDELCETIWQRFRHFSAEDILSIPAAIVQHVRGWNRPSQGIPLWLKYCNFYPDFVTDRSDYTEEKGRYYRQTVARKTGKNRVFVNKDNDNILRVGFLNEVFPTAKFVHVVRDGRAVALSLSRFKAGRIRNARTLIESYYKRYYQDRIRKGGCPSGLD
jgi:predicted nucleic acid-binding Zn finger protein